MRSSMVSFVHTSDWQIGMKGTGLGEAATLVRETRLKSINNIFKIAKDRKVDFVIIAGDTFENNSVSQDLVEKVVRVFNDNRDIPVYLLPGNHDFVGSGSIYNREIFQKVSNLTIMRETDRIEVKGAIIHPCPATSRYRIGDATKSIPVVKDDESIHIGVAHGSLAGKFSVTNWEDIDLPIDPNVVNRTGIDYLALGHWHGYRIFNDKIGNRRIAYSGTHEQTNYEETDAGYCLQVSIDKKGAVPLIEPVKTGQLTWASLTVQMGEASSFETLNRLLKDNEASDLVKLELLGELPLGSMKELDSLLNFQKTLHKNFKVRSERLSVFQPSQTDLPFDFRDPILGQVDKRLIEMLSSEKDYHQRAVITQALSYLRKRGGEE